MKIKITLFITVLMLLLTPTFASAITLEEALDTFYPVGSYYETSDSSFNPESEWGGTWQKQTDGYVTVSAGSGFTINSTGGTRDEYIPTHTHGRPAISGSLYTNGAHYTYLKYRQNYVAKDSKSHTYDIIYSYGTQTGGNRYTSTSGNHHHSVSTNINTNSTSSAASGSSNGVVTDGNLQPYINIVRWKRVG